MMSMKARPEAFRISVWHHLRAASDMTWRLLSGKLQAVQSHSKGPSLSFDVKKRVFFFILFFFFFVGIVKGGDPVKTFGSYALCVGGQTVVLMCNEKCTWQWSIIRRGCQHV